MGEGGGGGGKGLLSKGVGWVMGIEESMHYYTLLCATIKALMTRAHTPPSIGSCMLVTTPSSAFVAFPLCK